MLVDGTLPNTANINFIQKYSNIKFQKQNLQNSWYILIVHQLLY